MKARQVPLARPPGLKEVNEPPQSKRAKWIKQILPRDLRSIFFYVGFLGENIQEAIRDELLVGGTGGEGQGGC